MRKRLAACFLAAAAASPIWAVNSACGLTINLVAPATMSPDAVAAFRAAADRWQANFTDNITVTLNIDFQPLGTNVLGSTSTVRQSYSFSSVRTALTSDAAGSDDALAVASLPTGTALPRLINYTTNNPNGASSLTPYLQSPGVATLTMTKAGARAMGLSTNTGTDATITFSSQFTWDFDPGDGVNGGQVDFVGVATHEIGHALGFTSAVDSLDTSGGLLTDTSSTLRPSGMDLFRYSTQSRDTSGGVIDLSADTRDKYFSLDKGVTSLASHSTGKVNGDGKQASHWKDFQGLGIMGPSVGYATLMTISDLDRRMFDVIGWNRDFSWKWVGAANSTFNWDDPLRWDADGVPDARMDAAFNSAGSFGVSFQQNAAVRAMNISAGSVDLALSGQSLEVGHLAGTAVTVDAGAALSISGGTFKTTLGAASAGVTGANLLVNGNSRITLGSGTLLVGGAMLIGGSGAGTATAQFNAGAVSIGTEIGTDHNFYVGQSASARVDHADGVSVSVARNLMLAPATALLNSRYEMAGGSLSVGGGLSIGGTTAAATSGAATFAARGTGSVNVSGTTKVWSNGTLILDNTAGLATGSLEVTGGHVLLTSNGQKFLRTGSVSISLGGSVDLSNNSMIVDYSSTSPIGSIVSLVQSGYHSGAWDGAGIRSSSAAGDSQFALGYGEAADLFGDTASTFSGQPIDATAVLVDFTWTGDANLDGQVDVNDLFAVASNYNTTGQRWTSGDFNYDGTVNLQDLSLLAINWQAGVGSPLSAGDAGLSSMLASLDLPPISVPEPAAGLAAAMAAIALAGRKRRR